MGSGVFTRGRSIVARLEHGADLLDEIAALAERHGIEAGARPTCT
jgi:predicted DNA-binding protein with PD1-like motif